MKLHLPYSFRKALLAVLASTMCITSAYGAGMHSQVSIVTYTDFGQNMGRYRVNGVNDLLSSIRREEGGVVITYLEGHDDYTMDTPMISFESQGDNGALAAIGYNYIATVQHNGCQNPIFTGRYIGDANSLRYYGVEYRDALTFCLAAQSDDQTHTHDYKLTRMNRLITDVTPSTPAAPMSDEEILALAGTMEYRSGAGRMSLWSLDGTNTLLQAAYIYAIGGMRLIDKSGVNNSEEGFFTTTTTMDYSAQGISESNPLPFAPASGDSGSPVWIWDEDSQSYVYLNAYQSIFQAPGGGARSANARGAIDYTWKVLDKFNKEVTVSGSTVHITGVAVRDDDQVVTEGIIVDGRVDHTYTAKLHKGSVLDAQGNTLQQFVGVRGDGGKYINTWLNLSEVKNTDNWFAYDNKYYNVGVYDNKKRELEIQNLFFTENLVFQASSAADNTVAVDADTDMGIGYVQFGIAPDAAIDHADFTLQSNSRTSGGRDGAQRDFMLNSAGFVVDANVNLHVKLTNTEWDSTAGDYYYREWRKVGDGNLYLEGSGNNEILLNVGGAGKTYLAETGNGYAAYNVFAGSGATVVLDNINQIARGFTFGYTGATLDIRGNNSMEWYFPHADASREGFAINSQSEDAIITNSGAGTLSLTYRETGAAGKSEYLGSFVDTATGAVHITFNAGAGSETSLHSIHTDLSHNSASGITVQTGKVVLSGTNTVHARGSASGRNADRYFSADDWHYADMAAKVQVESGATFELGSHARLTGSLTLESGATAIIREGVHSTYEYIEGGLRPEDATQAFYRDFYGLKGDIITVAGSTVRFEYSPGTSAEQVYGGSITGGGDVYFELGGGGATLRLSGTNTFSGIKSLSGGGLISDNGLAALGLAEGDSYAWHVAADAFIAANNATGAQLLSLVKKDSTGVLALTQAQAADLNLQNMGYSGLIVGALEGMDVHYGTAGASLSTVRNGGKDRWLLGGGGGNLIVDFALQDGTAELVLGNEYTTGNVTLTNSSNEIGTISFMGQVTLSYTDEAALGGATVDLNYTNRMQLLSSSGLGGISSTSAGVVLVDKLDGAALDMTTHPELYIGSSSSKRLDAAPLIAPGAAYRFGGIDGTLTVNAVLANADSQPTGLFVDGQTFSGGVLELAQAATITGAVDVRGYDPARMLPTMVQKGDITLRLTAENAIASASSVTMEDGGIIDIYGTTQTLNNLGAEAGSLVTDSSLSGSGVLNLNNTTGTTFGGVLDVARVNKTGSGTLNLSGTSLVDAYNVQQGTLNVSAPAAISGVAYIQGGATLSLAAGDYGMVAALHDGANLRVADNATTTLGGLVLADNATANLSGGTLRVTDMETIIGNGATLNLTGASLALAIDEDLHFTNTLRASGGAASTVTVSGGNKDTSYTRVFDSISVDAGSTLTLEQGVQETAPAYEIHSLSGQGTFVISQGTYKDAPTFYKFNRDTEFAGTFKILANTGYSSHKYMSHTLIQSDNALANAQVQMQGWSSDSGYVTLGIDTENASIKGLETVINNRSILMAGVTAETTAQKAPVSTRRATLTITGSESKDFQGQVVGGADGTDNGLSIVMNGSGTQTFSGVSVFNDVSALKGTLRISNSNENTAIKGDLTVARGATLYISKAYTLGSGKTLHVVGKASANTAQLTVPLTFSGGTIDFSGDALNGSMAALHLSSSISGRATISFSETSLLQTGVTYKLADGNWSNISLTTASLDYLTASVSATSTGLTATFSLRGDSYIWNGNSTQHTWTTSNFGQRSMSFQNTYRAVFTDTAESKDVQVNASISAASLIIDSTGEYTFGGSGKVTASTLSQLASGTTNIGSSVKITGQAHVQAGTLAMLGGSSTGSVLVDEGATLVLKGVDATTGSVSGGGALVIDWEGQSGSIPAIGESGIGSLRVASGTLTTAAQLNVKNGTWVEQGTTLRSTVGGILSSGQALHLAGNLELNLAAAGSLTTSIAGYDDAKGSIAKTGNGALTVAAGISADSFTVSGGSVVVNMDASLDLNTLAIGSDRSVLVHRDGNSVRNIGSVQLGASSTLSLYSDTAPSTAMAMDSLVLQGDSATVKAENHAGALAFRSLSHSGTGTATLNLVNSATSYNVSIFELGGHDENPGDFTGDIVLTSTNSGPSRSAAVVLDDANVAAGAVVRLQSAASEGAILALGVNAEVVNIAGLASNSALGARTRVISGTIAPSRDSRQEAAFAGSEETHKLVITTASGSAYDFYGTIGRNVDLTVAGSGTQRLLGSGAAFSGMLTVQGGTLQIANAADFGSSSEKEGFSATLAGGTLALQGGGLNLGGGSLSVTGDTTISLDKEGEYSYRDGGDSDNGYFLMTVVSAGAAEHTAGTLTGQGVLAGRELLVMDNGVYALDSTHGHTYYVNTTVNYGPQAAGSAYANADSLVLNHNGAVLNMQAGLSDTAAANGIKAQVAGGQVNLAQGVTLHQNTITDTENVKIGGAGTYQVQVKTGDSNIDTTLGAANKVTLADGWTGTVELLGAGGFRSHLVLENYGNSLSTVKLTGNAGWLSSGKSFAVNLLLEDAENQSALTITNGSTNGQETFNGSISGSGTMEMAWDSTLDFKFNGDLSGWTGGFKTTAGTANVHLLAGVTDVGAAIQATSLTVGADASAGANVTFLNTVRAATFTAHCSVTVGDSGTLDLTALTSAATLDALTLGAGSTTVLNQTSMLTATGTLAVENGATLDLTGLSVSGAPQSYVLATGGNVTLGDSVSFTLADETLLGRASLGVVDGTSLVLTLAPATQNLVWQGPNGQWTTDAAQMPWYAEGTQTAASFRNGDSVRFGSASNTHTATLGADINAAALAVNENAAVTLALNSHALTTETLTVDSGSSLTVNGSGKVMEAAASAIGGSVVLGAGTTLKLNGAESSFTLGRVSLYNGAKLDVAAAGSVTAESVFVNDGCAAEISLAQDMAVTAGVSADSKAGALYTMGATKTLSIHSADAGSIKTLTVDKLDIANHNTAVSLQNVVLNVQGAATVGVLVTDRSNDDGIMTVGGGAVLNFNGSVDWHKAGSSDVVNLTVQSGGAAHVNNGAANTLNNITVQDGGTLSFAAGTTTALYGAISLEEQIANGGTLDFGGRSVGISLTSDGTAFHIKEAGYTNIAGEEDENGFSHSLMGDLASGSGNIANGGNVTITFGSSSFTGLNADGTFGTVDNTTYHVRSGAVEYSTLHGSSTITTVAVSDNATLNLDTALAANVGIASAGGTVNIDNAVVLQAASLTANAATTLAGGGAYALANANGMPANVQLSGNAWAGTVRFTGASSALDLAGAWVGSGKAASTVEFRDWSGSFAGNSATIGSKVQLAGGTAMTLSSAVETTVAFTNGVGGNADIAHSGAGRLNLSFTGDDVAWQGTFVNSDGTAEITYSNIGSVANSIFAMDGSVNVHLNNVGTYHGGISNASLHVSGTTAFNGSGYLTSLDIAQNANFSIGGSTTVMGNVDAGGTLAVAAGADLTLRGGIGSLAGQIANSGTLDFEGRSMGVSLTGGASAFGITPEGYTDIHDQEGDNGFHHTMTGDITSGSGSVAGGGSVAITFNGATVTGVAADGTFGTVDTATYHVRRGSVDYGAELAGTASITTIAVSGNAALNLDTALANGVKITSAGGSVNIGSGITLQAASLTASAATTLAGGGTYALADGTTALGNVRLGDSWSGTVRFAGASGALDLTGSWVGSGAAASTVEFRDWSGSLAGNGATIGARVQLSGTTAITLSNAAETTLAFANGVGGSAGIMHSGAGKLNLSFTGGDVAWQGTFVNYEGTADISYSNIGSVANSIFAMDGAVDVHLNNVGTFNGGISNAALHVSGTTAFNGDGFLTSLDIAQDAAFTIGGSTAVMGTVDADGTLAVAAGAHLTLQGNITSLAAQIANGGTLDFGGRSVGVSLTGAATAFGITPEGYTSISGVEGDNGFHHTMAGDITSGSGSIVDGGRVAVTFNGATVTGVNADGTFGTVDTATYHVRRGSVDYGAELAGTASITTVAVSGNATLNLNTGLANGVKITSAGGTVNIGNAVTLQAASLTANAATTLTGGGTYALAGGSTALGNNVHLGDSWRGTVRVSAATANGLNFGNLANTSLSTIELKGFTGWSDQWKNGTNTENIRLTNPDADTYAWTNRADTTSSGCATTFTGTWSGAGTLAVAPRALGYTFKGDISGWTGAMVNIDNRGYTSTLTFAEKAGVVKVAITDNATAKFAVVVNTDAEFSNNVAVHDSLTIAAGRAASFSGTNTFAGVTVQDGASLRIAGGTTTISGSVSLAEQVQNDGAITFGGSAQTITLANDPDAFHVLNPGYIDIDGNEGDNGFHHGLRGTVVTGDGTISGTDHVTVSYNGATHAFNADGTFGAVDKATYHVRSGSVDYGSDMAGVASITTVAVSNNAALNVNTALAANVGITSSGGSLNIAENVTVDHSSIQASAPTTLGGKGRLVLANNSIAMPDNVTLGADWEGVVAVSGLSQSGTFTPAPLANDNSWIEIKGLSGYLSTAGNSTYVVSSNLVLAGDADGWAFKQNNGYGGSTVSFTGAIKGSGNLGRSVGTGSTYTYEFSGDISGWNGQFISTNNNNCYTMFRVKGDATLVNAELVQSNSTASNKDFRVEVQNHATFTKSLSADKLTVTSGGEATFTGESVQFKDVTLNADAGLVVSSATSARFTGNVDLYEAITNNGILTIDSLSSIDHLAVSEDSLYRDGNDSRNGFLYAERVQVVNMGENAQLTVTTKPTSYNGKAGTLDTNTGVFSVTEARESYDTFYVNKAGTTESLANAIQKSYSAVESIRMAGGTTLDASNVMEGAVLDNLILREHGDAAPATITGGTAAFRNLVMEGAVSSVSVEEGAKLKVGNVIEVETNHSLATGGGGLFEATTLRSTGGVVQFSGNTLVSGGGSGQGGTNNKLGLAITGNGGTIALNGGTTTVTGAVYTNAQNTAIEVGTAGQDATLVATRMELGDNGGGAGTLTVGDNGKVVVTGGVNGRGTSNLKNDSLVLGEWSQAYTTNVQGSLYARDAIAMLSKDAAQSVSVQGGTMAVKGVWSITDDGEKNHNLSVTDGGRLILGESGIVAEKGSWNIDVTDSELGMYADTTVGRAVNLHGKVVVNTDKYEFKGTGAAQEVVQGASAGNMAVSGAVNADANATLSKSGSGTLEITGSTAGFHGSVEVQGGVMDIMNAASVDVQNVTIGSNGTLGVYKGATAARESDSEGTITIREAKTLTAGKDAALNANLVMESGSTLDVSRAEGMGLLMGSEVTLSKGMTLNDYSADWATWKDGTAYTLFAGVDGLDLGNGMTTGALDYTKWVDAKEYFSNIEESNRYFLCYGGAPDQNAVGVLTSVNNGSNVGMVYIMTMPEPTTSTLSLLALAALAARRRRK